MTIIEANRRSLRSTLHDYREYGTLLYFLAMRDIRLRYRQTWLGVAWAILQPLLPMLILGAVFSRVLHGTTDIPYTLYVLSGLAPWTFVASAINAGSPTFVNNFNLLNKVYFPRAILPAAAVSATALDGLVGTAAAIAFAWWSGFLPRWEWLLLPLIYGLAVILAMAATLLAASLMTLFRDMKNVVPFGVQIWMYASPVLYPLPLVPEPLRMLAGFNPMTGVLELFRSALLGTALNNTLLAQSALGLLVLIVAAFLVFESLEADLAERV